MIDLDLFFYLWLGNLLRPIENLAVNWPLQAWVSVLIAVRHPLASFVNNPDRGRAFPGTARIAAEMVTVIDEIVPPIEPGQTQVSVNVLPRIQQNQVDRLRALCNGLMATFREEAEHSYVLKVEDQRCFSSYALVEKIETCFSPEAWSAIEADARRELVESGKCLALERYTGAGFHALRGVECVIRQYILRLTGKLPARDSKRDWWTYIEILRENDVDEKVTTMLDHIRKLERNPLMHPEDWLDIDEAIAIFSISQSAISRLASAIQKCPVTAPPA